jgi:hypothetical protein
LNLGPRVQHIGQNAGGAEKHIILNRGAFVYRNIVLNFDIVADDDPACDADILAQIAVAADDSPGQNMGKMPDLGTPADADIVIHIGGFMDKTFRMRCIHMIRPFIKVMGSGLG